MPINENEIRPQDLMAGLADAVEADRNWLIERQAQFVTVQCPVCSGPGHYEMTKKEFVYERCDNCRTMFMNPRPSEPILHGFYTQSKTYSYWNEFVFPASENKRRQHIFQPRASRVLEFCDRYQIQTDVLLEIGAGFGTFCEEMRTRDTFKQIIALEMTPNLAETCRSRGLQVIEEPVEKVDLPDQSVNVLAAFETLEHLFSPEAFLKNCHRLLAKNGLLVITCPSCEGFDVVALREVSDTIDHEHLNYLNPTSIAQLATKCGFRVLEVLTPGVLDADIVRNKALQGQFSLEHQPWLKQILIEKWDTLGERFQSFLSSNQLSTHMWMVATRD